MPLFDYRCEKCQSVSELLVSSSTTSVTCPQCGSEAMEKQLSAPVPPGRTKQLVSNMRKAANAEGHFSNYSRAERSRIG